MLIQNYPAKAHHPISLRSLYHYLHFSNVLKIVYFLQVFYQNCIYLSVLLIRSSFPAHLILLYFTCLALKFFFIIFYILILCSFVRARHQFSKTCKLSNITPFFFLSCIYTVHLTRSRNRQTNTCTLLIFYLLKLI